MGAANYTIKQQDRGVILASMDGIYAGAVIISDQGKTHPQLVTDVTQLDSRYGVANPANGVSQYGVKTYLGQSNKIWVNRAVHADAKYAAALVRSKVDSIPTNIPNGSWVPDRIVSPLTNGLTQDELDAYQFPVYNTDRVYAKLATTLVVPVTNAKYVRVNSLKDLKAGDALYLGNDPKNDSPLHTIMKAEEVIENFDKLTLNKEVTVTKGAKIRMAAVSFEPLTGNVTVKGAILPNATTFTVSNSSNINVNDVLRLGSETEVTVLSKNGNTITVKGIVGASVDNEVLVYKRKLEFKEYQGNPIVTRSMVGSNEILVSKSDFIGNDDDIAIGEGNDVIVATVKTKNTYEETHFYLTLDNEFTGNTDTVFNKMVHSEFEDRDAFLVTYSSVSKNGKYVSVAIAPSKDYTEDDVTENFLLPFNVLVYYKGVLVETFENVAMQLQLDGKGDQLYIENRINGVSEYIEVKVNPQNVDENGKPRNPLYTNYSVWRKLPFDIFNPVKDKAGTANVSITEDILADDINIRVSDNTKISLGDRIKFNGYDAEYKVTDKTSYQFGGKTIYEITLDRGAVIAKDNAIKKIPKETVVTQFNPALEDTEKGIYAGVQYYRPTKIPNVYYNYPLNVIFNVGKEKGQLLDSGANLLLGGSNGSPVTVADIIKAFKPFYNKNKYQVNILLDTGHTFPAVAQELDAIASKRGTCHAYVSMDVNAEKKADYVTAITEYYNSLMLNSEYTSVFTGWVKVLDENNNVELYVDPASFGAASQAFTTRNYQMFYPAAGWTRGKIRGLGVMREFTDGELDVLVDSRMNPIRYKEGSGMVIWGNETTYRKPSPLQQRSVNWLLIMIKYGLESSLEFQLFELLNERTMDALETAIRTFMRDEIKAKGGVYDFQVAVSSIITDSDKEQRRMPVFLGIKPTSDVKFIPVTLAVFSASQKIDVSL